MGKCKLLDCPGRLRLDGSCSAPLCPLYRPSKRPHCNTWILKAKMFLKSLLSKKKKSKSMRRLRICSKRAPESPPSDKVFSRESPVISSSSSQKQKHRPGQTLQPAVCNEGDDDACRAQDALKDDIMEKLVLLGECDDVRHLRCFFKFRSQRDDPLLYVDGSLECLSAAVGSYFDKAVEEVGEPRALAMYSNISGILQKLPSGTVLLPSKNYVASLFYLGWELAGSWEQNSPSIITTGSQAEVLAGVYKLMNMINRV